MIVAQNCAFACVTLVCLCVGKMNTKSTATTTKTAKQKKIQGECTKKEAIKDTQLIIINKNVDLVRGSQSTVESSIFLFFHLLIEIEFKLSLFSRKSNFMFLYIFF